MALTFTTTTKHALRWLTGANVISDIDAGFQALAEDIDAKLTAYSQGLLSARPTSTAGSPGVTGRHYYATDLGLEFIDYGTGWAPSGIAIGGGFDWYSTTDPCAEIMIGDGRALSRTTYAALFAKISTTYGVGNGSTTFNIPDTRGRVLVGPDIGPSTGDAARLTASDTLGASGGEEKHVLTVGEMPGHAHNLQMVTSSNFAGDNPAPSAGSDANGGTTTAVTASQGGGTSHNNMSPFIIVSKAIRVL